MQKANSVLVAGPAIEEEAASAGEGNGLAVITVVVVTPCKFKCFRVLCTVLSLKKATSNQNHLREIDNN